MRAEEKKVYQHKSYFARIDGEPYAAGDLSSDPDNVDPEVGTLADHPTVRYQPEVGSVGVVPAQLRQRLSPRAAHGTKRKASRSLSEGTSGSDSDTESSLDVSSGGESDGGSSWGFEGTE